MGTIVSQVWAQLSDENKVVIKFNHLCSHVDGLKFCIYLIRFNVCHFGMAEAT
jgi:hypothetical protein